MTITDRLLELPTDNTPLYRSSEHAPANSFDIPTIQSGPIRHAYTSPTAFDNALETLCATIIRFRRLWACLDSPQLFLTTTVKPVEGQVSKEGVHLEVPTTPAIVAEVRLMILAEVKCALAQLNIVADEKMLSNILSAPTPTASGDHQ